MQLHHSKHHATYVNNLNVAEEKYHEALAKGDKVYPVIYMFSSVAQQTNCLVYDLEKYCILVIHVKFFIAVSSYQFLPFVTMLSYR